MRKMLVVFKWLAIVIIGSFVALIISGIAGYKSPFPELDVTQEKPFADFIGREYRVKSELSAYAWNDFPDKTKILTVTLEPRPLARTRFVSNVIPIPKDQKIRILSAWKRFALVEFHRHYLVSLPGSDLPPDVPIRMHITADGYPDPNIYEPVN